MRGNPNPSSVRVPAFGRFADSVKHYGFGDPITPFFKATESFSKCETLHRRAGRAKKLKLPKAQYYEKMAMLHNRQGLSSLQEARRSAKKAMKMYPEIEKKCGLLPERQKKRILGETDILFKDMIFEMETTAEVAEEIWALYGKARNTVDTKGMRGLIGYCSSKLDELVEARTHLDKGRKPASPIGWALAIIIAVVIGVTVGAVLHCYNKLGCRWVEDLLKASMCVLLAAFGAPYEYLKRITCMQYFTV